MSSDTPIADRTEKELECDSGELSVSENRLIGIIQGLERELAEARKELAEYRAATDPHYVDELAALKAENEQMKIDAGKAYCVYCGTSGPKADIWEHVKVCDKHPLKTMADKMEEASGMIQVAMLIFDELGLSGDATAVTAVESIQKLKAENERLTNAIHTHVLTGMFPKDFDLLPYYDKALASRGRENVEHHARPEST